MRRTLLEKNGAFDTADGSPTSGTRHWLHWYRPRYANAYCYRQASSYGYPSTTGTRYANCLFWPQ